MTSETSMTSTPDLPSNRKLFVTTALPYANGKLHLGHLLEYVQADVWVRAQRMCGHSVQFVCADDAHGAPIMIAAQNAGTDPESYVASVTANRGRYLRGFHVEFDNWHSTHSAENTELAHQVYGALRDAGMIATRTIAQFYDRAKGMFLPDRFVKGTCPVCRATDQYGDSCELCGAVYQPTALIDPYSTLTGTKPELRESEHLFFTLSQQRAVQFLKEWVASGTLAPDITKKTSEWFESGLMDWDISRDAPYFGIALPDAPDKFFYVWLDAPIGYLASLKNHFDKGQAEAHPHAPSRTSQTFEAYVSDPRVEQVHFIGKDIVYFHTLFWPAMLHFSGRKTPTAVHVHGHLTVNGEKMSKSRGNGLDPLHYLALGHNPEWMRYYLSAKLNSRADDIDFNTAEFSQRVNADLVGKYVNIASRAAGFIAKRFEGELGHMDEEALALIARLQNFVHVASDFYDQREFAKCVRETMLQADRVNEYFDKHTPWVLGKTPGMEPRLQQVCTASIEAFRLLTICLKPILPALAERVEAFLRVGPMTFADAKTTLGAGHRIGDYQHLIRRVEPNAIEEAFEPAVGVTA